MRSKQKGLKQLEDLVVRSPLDALPDIKQVARGLRSRDGDLVRSSIDSLLRKAPESDIAHAIAAEAHLELGNVDLAYKHIAICLALTPRPGICMSVLVQLLDDEKVAEVIVKLDNLRRPGSRGLKGDAESREAWLKKFDDRL